MLTQLDTLGNNQCSTLALSDLQITLTVQNITTEQTMTITHANANTFHTVDLTSTTNFQLTDHGGSLGTLATTSLTAFSTCNQFYPVEASNGLEDTEAIENTYLQH